MSQALIRKTFMTALAAWANNRTPKLEIAREGDKFSKPSADAFIEAIVFPAPTILRTVDGRLRYIGEFAINIWTKDDIGAGLAEQIAGEIEALFPVVPKNYLPLSVEFPPSAKKALSAGDGWRVVPVAIQYRLDT